MLGASRRRAHEELQRNGNGINHDPLEDSRKIPAGNVGFCWGVYIMERERERERERDIYIYISIHMHIYIYIFMHIICIYSFSSLGSRV